MTGLTMLKVAFRLAAIHDTVGLPVPTNAFRGMST
jgi:hypothetical protein